MEKAVIIRKSLIANCFNSHPWGALLSSALMIAVVYFINYCFPFAKNNQLLLTSAISFGAVMSGFVGTSLSILTSLDTVLINKLRGTERIQELRFYMGWGLASGVFVVFVSMSGLLWSLEGNSVFMMLWMFFLFFCVINLYRLANIMLWVFSHSENKKER